MPIRLLKTRGEKLVLVEKATPLVDVEYAIISHTWGEGEITYDDLSKLSFDHLVSKTGWHKLEACRRYASINFEYMWIDTLCIDKTSSAELSEALNSMFEWYQSATVCYAYLDIKDSEYVDDGHPDLDNRARQKLEVNTSVQRLSRTTTMSENSDISIKDQSGEGFALGLVSRPTIQGQESTTNAINEMINTHQKLDDPRRSLYYHLRQFRWFRRGWTLQEMIAPKHVIFVLPEANSCKSIGTLVELADIISEITRIDESLLKGQRTLDSFSIAQKMSWAAMRKTTRVEDRAYSLIGIFNVSLTAIYGEGTRAFERLQQELLRQTIDLTIFAWNDENIGTDSNPYARFNLLADSPDRFDKSGHYINRQTDFSLQPCEVVGNHIRFHTYAFAYERNSRFIKEKRASHCIVLARDQRSSAQVITLSIRQALGSSSFYFVEDRERWTTTKQRLHVDDITETYKSAKIETINVWTRFEGVSQAAEEDKSMTYLCRSDAPWHIVSRSLSGTCSWDEDLQALVVLRYYQSDSQHTVTLNLERREGTSIRAIATLEVSDDAESLRRWVHKGIVQHLCNLPFNLVDGIWMWTYGGVLIAEITREDLMGEEVYLLQIQQAGIWRSCALVGWLLRVFIIRGSFWLLSVMPLLLVTIVPLLSIILARRRLYIHHTEPGSWQIDESEWLLAWAVLPLMLAWKSPAFLAFLREMRGISFDPSDDFYLESEPAYYTRFRRQFENRSHIQEQICNLAIIIMCIVYMRCAQTLCGDITRYGLSVDSEIIGLCGEKYSTALATVRLTFGLISLGSFLCIVDTFGLVQLATSIVAVMALLWDATATPLIIGPWDSAACSNMAVNALAVDFYERFADLTGSSSMQICARFAFHAKTLWALIGLCFLDIVLVIKWVASRYKMLPYWLR